MNPSAQDTFATSRSLGRTPPPQHRAAAAPKVNGAFLMQARAAPQPVTARAVLQPVAPLATPQHPMLMQHGLTMSPTMSAESRTEVGKRGSWHYNVRVVVGGVGSQR
jgi:hypothetical protein